jgi:predicted AAA+ superfamily ATPase
MELLSRFLPIPDQSFFLFGPRGTGKTTWLRQRFSDALFIDLLLPQTYRRLRARPERLLEMVAGAQPAATVVVDEVQRVPELLNVVHHLMEGPDRRLFVLTGSSARKLRRGGVDLLAGRALQRGMHPFMAAELPGFRLDRALEHGMLPIVLASDQPEEVLAAYANLYLEEEVQVEGWARNIGDFARFLEAISFSHGQVLNVANIARECEAERKTVAGYIEVLEDLLLCFRLPVFNRRARRKTSSHPKLYLFDTGVFRSLRPSGPIDRPEEIEGAALEGLVAQHLRAWIDYSRRRCDLYFWRTRSGVEIDFVIYGEEDFWAIEVKNSDRIRPQDLRPLRTFISDYPESRAILLYRGSERLRIDDIWCLPAEGFLSKLHPSGGLSENEFRS